MIAPKTPIKELNEYARLHNISYIIHNRMICGIRKFDYAIGNKND